MSALSIKIPVGAGVVGLKPEALPSRLKFDEAGLVVRAFYRAYDMLSDIATETLEDCGLRRFALCHDDIWTQGSQFSGNEAATVVE